MVLRTNAESQITVTSQISFDNSVYIQVWDAENRFSGDTQSFDIRLRGSPLDPVGLETEEPVYRDVLHGAEGLHLRVYSVPLLAEVLGRIGTLQVATNLSDLDGARSSLLQTLLLTGLLTMSVAALGGWLAIHRALIPLSVATNTASEITRADDLSRRIPLPSTEKDEVGLLITAFNQTLGRLEGLFNSQRRFIADVGHELRTPLTVIKGNADLMRRLGSMDEQSLTSIDQEVDRLTRMVGDLLLLAQAESGKLPLDFRPVALDTILLEVFQQVHVLAHEKHKLRITEIDQILVCGDADRLKQVALNLMSNAIKYTPIGGEIEVSLSKQAGQACFSVKDNGPGIPAADLPHIFERFYRAEKARSRSKDGKGFGLGLSIAYWIVQNHGGRIYAESQEGIGTTFFVWLPLAEAGKECQQPVMDLDPGVGLPERID